MNMEKTEVEQAWEQEEDLDEGLRGRRKALNQAQVTIDVNGHGDFNNDGSVAEEEEEEEEEKVNGFGQQNGTTFVEEEQEQQQQKPEYCVYYHTDEGIWKCRICSWDYRGRTCITSPNRHSNEKTDDQQRPCFLHEAKGTKSRIESSAAEENGIDSSAPKGNRVRENLEITGKKQENGSSSLGPSETPPDRSHEIEREDPDEFDVETVLKEQETHDLYCPNCNSCITKRVILRKRKRGARQAPDDDAKRNRPEAGALTSAQPSSSAGPDDDQARNEVDLGLDDTQREQPDVFRCLSCFSIFMPTGNGFKLFRMFGDQSDERKSQRPLKPERVKKGWFSSVFSSNKTEILIDHEVESSVGGASVRSPNLNERNSPASWRQEASSSTVNGSEGQTSKNSQLGSPVCAVGGVCNAPSPIQGAAEIEHAVAEGKRKGAAPTSPAGVNTVDQLVTSYHTQSDSKSGMNTVDHSVTSYHTQSDGKVDQSVTSYHTQSDGKGEVNTVDQWTSSSQTESDGRNETNTMHQSSTSYHAQPDAENASFLVNQNTKLDATFQMGSPDITFEASQPHVAQNIVEIHALTSPTHDALRLHDKRVKLLEDFRNVGRATESAQLDSFDSQSQLDTLVMAGTRAPQRIGTVNRTVEEGGTAAAPERRSLNIIKSIVYGGLMESIASVSVVASAAGSGASTLNVLALGMANIFGGFFVITHDLWDLRNECERGASDAEPARPDRYQQLLGRRADFRLHAAVALISYFIFGLLPPLVYGFSFWRRDDGDLKLLTVAAVSVACIVALAAGKARVVRPRKPYFQTMVYYVVFAFVVSGASFASGDLIMKLLEKLDVFQPARTVGLGRQGTSPSSALATY